MKKFALLSIITLSLTTNTVLAANPTFQQVSSPGSPYHICKILGVKVCRLPNCTQGYTSRPNNSATQATTTPVPTTQATTKAEATTQATTKAEATTEATTAAPVTTPQAASNYAQRVLDLVNAERAKNKLAPLTLDSSLNGVAQAKADDMRTKGYFNHTSPTYGSPFDMLKAFGVSYRYAGENIAKGQKTPEAVVAAWMNSPGHRANILNKGYGKMGLGYSKGGSTYWAQIFTD